MLYHASCNGYSMPIIDNFKSHEDNVIASALGYIMHLPLASASCTITSSECASLKTQSSLGLS